MGRHLRWWISFKVTVFVQQLIWNIHAMFSLIHFSGSLKGDICMYFPYCPMWDKVPRWRPSWMMNLLQVTTLGQHLIRNMHNLFCFIPFSSSLLEDMCTIYCPYGPMLNEVSRYRPYWMIDWLQSNNTWSEPHQEH